MTANAIVKGVSMIDPLCTHKQKFFQRYDSDDEIGTLSRCREVMISSTFAAAAATVCRTTGLEETAKKVNARLLLRLSRPHRANIRANNGTGHWTEALQSQSIAGRQQSIQTQFALDPWLGTGLLAIATSTLFGVSHAAVFRCRAQGITVAFS